MDKNECRCPVCGDKLTIHKEAQNGGMDGQHYDWVVDCENCHLLRIKYAADNFHGREYYETLEAVTDDLKNYIREVQSRAKAVLQEMRSRGEIE